VKGGCAGDHAFVRQGKALWGDFGEYKGIEVLTEIFEFLCKKELMTVPFNRNYISTTFSVISKKASSGIPAFSKVMPPSRRNLSPS